MRSRLKKITAACVLAVALTALTASAAFAFPNWYVKKGTSWLPVESAVHVTVEGKFGFLDSHGVELGLSCPISGKATLKANGAAEITEFHVANVSNCTPLGKNFPCTQIERFEAANIPWATELYWAVPGSEIRERLTGAEPHTPEFNFLCKTSLGERSDTCQLNTSARLTNVESTGEVWAEFDSKSAKTKCSQGGTEPTGTPSEVLKLKPTAEEKAKGISGIGVE
jgi:hypothetical protein